MTRDITHRLRTSAAQACVFAAVLSAALPAFATSLVEAISLARRNDPAYRGALSEYVAGQAAIAQGKAALRPQVAFSASEGRARIERDFIGRAAQPSTDESVATFNRTLQIRQPLYNRDASARADIGAKRADIADKNLGVQIGNLITRVTRAYLDAIAAHDELALATSLVEHFESQRRMVESQLKAGESTRVEVTDAQAREDIARARQIQARDGLDLALQVLSGFTGEDITQVDRLRDDIPLPVTDEARYEIWKARLLDSNPDIVAARKAVELQELELERRKGADKPRLDLIALRTQLQSDTVNVINQRIDQTALNVQLQIPLYTGGAYSADIEEQEGNVGKARADAEEVARRQLVELRKAWTVLLSARVRLAALEKALSASRLLLQSAETGVRNRVNVMADVLDARRQLTQAQRELGRARQETIDAYLQALILSGEVTEDNLIDLQQFFTAR